MSLSLLRSIHSNSSQNDEETCLMHKPEERNIWEGDISFASKPGSKTFLQSNSEFQLSTGHDTKHES